MRLTWSVRSYREWSCEWCCYWRRRCWRNWRRQRRRLRRPLYDARVPWNPTRRTSGRSCGHPPSTTTSHPWPPLTWRRRLPPVEACPDVVKIHFNPRQHTPSLIISQSINSSSQTHTHTRTHTLPNHTIRLTAKSLPIANPSLTKQNLESRRKKSQMLFVDCQHVTFRLHGTHAIQRTEGQSGFWRRRYSSQLQLASVSPFSQHLIRERESCVHVQHTEIKGRSFPPRKRPKTRYPAAFRHHGVTIQPSSESCRKSTTRDDSGNIKIKTKRKKEENNHVLMFFKVVPDDNFSLTMKRIIFFSLFSLSQGRMTSLRFPFPENRTGLPCLPWHHKLTLWNIVQCPPSQVDTVKQSAWTRSTFKTIGKSALTKWLDYMLLETFSAGAQ